MNIDEHAVINDTFLFLVIIDIITRKNYNVRQISRRSL